MIENTINHLYDPKNIIRVVDTKFIQMDRIEEKL